jgi:hypothetical protein
LEYTQVSQTEEQKCAIWHNTNRHIYIPEAYDGCSFAIPIPKEAVLQLQGTLGMTHEEAFQWPRVDAEFNDAAFCAYIELRSSELTSASAVTGWNGFHQVYREKLLKYYINGLSPFMQRKSKIYMSSLAIMLPSFHQ